MSADNMMVVSKWPDGYRVGMCFASDGDEGWAAALKDKPLIKDRAAALAVAHDEARNDYYEYGVVEWEVPPSKAGASQG